MQTKYELLMDEENTIEFCGHTLHRIRALIDFDDVKAGDIGGYIEKEENLSHCGTCWIYDNAKVYDNALVSDNAKLYNTARAYENAEIMNNAKLYNAAYVYGDAYVYGNAEMHDYCEAGGVCDINDNAKIFGDTFVLGNVEIHGNAKVKDAYMQFLDMDICLNAVINGENDYCCINGFGHENRTTTFYRLENGDIGVSCGCFSGTLKEFKKKVRKTHGHNKYAKQYMTAIKLVKLKLK